MGGVIEQSDRVGRGFGDTLPQFREFDCLVSKGPGHSMHGSGSRLDRQTTLFGTRLTNDANQGKSGTDTGRYTSVVVLLLYGPVAGTIKPAARPWRPTLKHPITFLPFATIVSPNPNSSSLHCHFMIVLISRPWD